MMIPRNFIYGIFLMCVTTVTAAGLVNDMCDTVSIRDDISNRIAKVTCTDYAIVFDPKSQNGSYLLNDIGNWAGEIFACLCSCRVPLDLKNGQILSKNRIPHGKTLNYSCDDSFEINIDKKIVCLDGLLMTVPGYLEIPDIDISTRQKSLAYWFANKFDGKVFDLWLNESANWSIPDTELQKNQKVFQILSENETILQYYMCKGKGCMLGCVNLGMGGQDCISLGIRGLECKRKLSGTAVVSSSQDLPSWVMPFIGGAVGVAVVIILVTIICCFVKRRNIKNKRKGKKESQDKLGTEEGITPLQEQERQEQTEAILGINQ